MIALISLFVACTASNDSNEVACTDIAMASVVVHARDLNGQPLSAARISWSVDGGEPQEITCDASNCDSVPLTYEVAGHFSVEVYNAAVHEDPLCGYTGMYAEEVDVGMDESGCHVEGRQIDAKVNTEEAVCQ